MRKGSNSEEQSIKSIGVDVDRSHDGSGHCPCSSVSASARPDSFLNFASPDVCVERPLVSVSFASMPKMM